MRGNILNKIRDKISPLFFILMTTGLGFVFGVISIAFWKGNWLISDGILNQDFIYKIEEINVNKRALFFLCLEKRLGAFFLLFLLAFSSVNVWANIFFFFLNGLYMGSIIELMSMRYGIQGILMYMSLVLPHGFFYTVGYLKLGCWCLKIEKSIYEELRKKEAKVRYFKNKGSLIAALAWVLLGVVLESYVNLKIFKIFF